MEIRVLALRHEPYSDYCAARRCPAVLHAIVWFFCSFRCIATDVLTYHNDNARTGWNPNEVILTPANVNPDAFGLIFNLIVDGKVDAQPLYVSNAPVFKGGISQGNHNLIVVATEHDSLYAFDADTGVLYWQSVLLVSGETTSEPRFGCDQVTPEIGITATPVIDRNKGAHGTIYVVAMSKAGVVYHQRLWGIDLATGQDVAGSPVDIQASFSGNGPTNDGNGHVLFDPGAYKERCGLLLLDGLIYTMWASHCDIAPYTSWIIAYDETSLQQVRLLNLDPNGGAASSSAPGGSGNAFWNSGAGPAADPNGFIYALTANGPFDGTLTANGFPNTGDYGDTFLKLSTAGSLSVSDYFTPFDQANAAAHDIDLGSGGVVVLPDMVDQNGATRHLAIGAGKDTNIYLVDRDNMGKFNPAGNSNIYQELASALPGGEFATAAYFNGAVYYGPVGGSLRKFTFTQALLDRIPTAMTSTVFSYPGGTPSVSSSGTHAAIVWAYENPNGGGPAVLHAYNASDLTELYNSNQRRGRDQFGVANKFITPTICNGKVLVGTTNSVGVFGLLNSPPPSPNPSPNPIPSPGNPPGYGTPTLTIPSTNGAPASAGILWQNTSTGSIGLWLMQGTNVTATQFLGQFDPSWKIAGIGHFNGNGPNDILWYNAQLGLVGVWTMNETTPTGSYVLNGGSPDWDLIAVADFDHTGFSDILWRQKSSGDIYLWKGAARMSFAPIFIASVDPVWQLSGVADIEGSGSPDLIWRNTATGGLGIWQLVNDRLGQQVFLGNYSLDFVIAGFGDFNGDGKADILWRNRKSGDVYVWLMNGFSIAGAWYAGQANLNWQVVATPTLVPGGTNDILWINTADGTVGAWLGSLGGFTKPAPFSSVSAGWLPMPALR
jgi:hypothetical protein